MYPDQLETQIRFGLSQLSAKNGSSDFEKICLHYSRKRIHINILPATGPVQSGGDQGRDFETFHTYMNALPKANSFFVGNISKDPVAFACSLEKNPTKKKIREDVESIIKSGTTVERIYFFSVEDIPVATRHKCINKIKEDLKVDLEIIDAQALSMHLTEGDIFWIAVQYLKIPAELYPIMPEGWYAKLYTKYKGIESVDLTFEEFCDVKSACRKVYKDEHLKKDLLFWIPKLDQFINSLDCSRLLQRKSIYEKFVASLMGLDDVAGQENLIENYFSDLESYDSVSDIEDCEILLSFCNTAIKFGRLNISIKYIETIFTRLDQLIKNRLETTTSIDTKAGLTEMKAFLSFYRNDGKDFLIEKKLSTLANQLLDVFLLLKSTTYYSVIKLSEKIEKFIDLFVEMEIDTKLLEDFATKLNPFLEKEGGSDFIAKSIRKKALVFINNNQHVKAIPYLHDLKLRWFKTNSMGGCIMTCLLLAESYKSLKMFYAAKYYAFISVFLAVNENEVENYKHVVRGLSIASDCDYASGSWFNFMSLLDYLIKTHYRVTRKFDVFESHDKYKILYYPAIVKKVADLYIPDLIPTLAERTSNWGFIAEEIAEIGTAIESKMSEGDIIERITIQLSDKPFNDVGASRCIHFNAQGVSWSLNFSNTYELNLMVEEFISTFQIFLVDVNDDEFFIAPTEVDLVVRKSENATGNFDIIIENGKLVWKLDLPPITSQNITKGERHTFHYLALAQMLLRQVCFIKDTDFRRIILGKIAETNILSKTTFAQTYSDLLQNFISEKEFDFQLRTTAKNSIIYSSQKGEKNDMLELKTSLSPTYNAEEARIAINRRIEAYKKTLSITLPLLQKSKNFRKVIQNLRVAGWLDWHIGNAICTIVFNFKTQGLFQSSLSQEEKNKTFSILKQKDESEWYVKIEEQHITEELLLQALTMIIPPSLLFSFGLENCSKSPSGKAINNLLTNRFNYFKDGAELKLFD